MSDPRGKCFDLGFLTSMTGGNKERMVKYINLFLNNAPGLVAQLDTNLKQADWPALKSTAHTLKSQFSYMGIAEAQALALQVEKNADDKTNLEMLPEQIEKIRNLFHRACDELKTELTVL